MAEAVKGIDKIILMRPYSLRTMEAAGRLAFQTQQEITRTRAADSIKTKDGNIQAPSELTVSMSLTSVMAQDDPTKDKLEEAFETNGLVEFWDINKSKPSSEAGGVTKYPARYYQGHITDWGETAGAEGNVDISLSIAINGTGAKGEATLTEDQAAVVQYVFEDTTKASE